MAEDNYKKMDVVGANRECGSQFHVRLGKRARCATCKMKVILHCWICKIQVTGCLCTAKERATPEERRQMEERAKRAKAGLPIIGPIGEF